MTEQTTIRCGEQDLVTLHGLVDRLPGEIVEIEHDVHSRQIVDISGTYRVTRRGLELALVETEPTSLDHILYVEKIS